MQIRLLLTNKILCIFFLHTQVIEKRRRDRINNCLMELRRLVPQAFEKQVCCYDTCCRSCGCLCPILPFLSCFTRGAVSLAVSGFLDSDKSFEYSAPCAHALVFVHLFEDAGYTIPKRPNISNTCCEFLLRLAEKQCTFKS